MDRIAAGSANPPPLRTAIAGAGMIGRVHLDAVRRSGAPVVGISASSPARAKEAAAELGVPRAFDSSRELVTSDDVDVVHICTPNDVHAELAELALRAGKHVVCEKPLTTGAATADALAALAAATGRVAAVPFVYRYHPMAAEARARVLDGRAGEIRLVHGHYLQDWLSEPGDTNWRVDAVAGGPSRAFADIGSHWCDLVEWVTGHRIAEVTAVSQTVARDGGRPGTEDVVQLLLRTDRGATGSLTVSQISPGRKNRLWFEVDGARTSLAFDQENPESLFVGSRGENAAVLRDPATLSPAAARLSTVPGGHPMGYLDCFAAFVRDVHGAIRAGTPTTADAPSPGGGSSPAEPAFGFPTFDDAARMVRLTEAVLASAASRSWKEVS
ncbi:Predicted dehydrogenase [Streptomyces sp. DvalAA-14]|uniref:Gfo/Idh/MocA family protein n=1 Tax=unclassified Streptomyces TaxID=2593676 RepID=UPI00081B27F1|nr:Gfo/Idh/MocA family oxidoreductase [Streptomyces sp. DvalAA-14]SCD28282.1 Predicted dehydrogenase [Streptomyces sp. DvalAA-14]